MAIVGSELKMYKSKVVSDEVGNGGLMDNSAQVISGVVNNVWPSVFKAERLSGGTKYRKTFLKVADDDDGTLFNPQIWMDIVTQGDDWVIFFAGTQTDTQNDITGTENKYGCAVLQTNVSAGGGSVVVTVEDSSLASGNDAIFRDGDTIRITNKDTPSSVAGTEEIHVIDGAPGVSGNSVTLNLVNTLASPYNTTDNLYGTRVMSVLEPSDIVASFANFAHNTAGDGIYNDSLHPVLLDNIGTINQTITITFTGATTFTVTSNVSGVTLTGGSTGVDYAPNNPDVGKPYFILEKDGFTGTWSSGDEIVFDTIPSAYAIWQKRIVPAGASSLTGNKAVVVFTGESV